jgi:hypothetical protein
MERRFEVFKIGTCAELSDIVRVQLHRVKWACDRTNRFIDEPNHFLLFGRDNILDVQKLTWVRRLDQNHTTALLDVLDYCAKRNQFVQIVE